MRDELNEADVHVCSRTIRGRIGGVPGGVCAAGETGGVGRGLVDKMCRRRRGGALHVRRIACTGDFVSAAAFVHISPPWTLFRRCFFGLAVGGPLDASRFCGCLP